MRRKRAEAKPKKPARDEHRLASTRAASPRGLLWVAVVGLLVVHFVLAVTSVRHKCATYDEHAHLTRGYSYTITDDFRLGPPHPPAAHYWVALPGRGNRVVFPKLDQDAWRTSDIWKIGPQFFYKCGNDIRRILFQGRMMITLLSAALGVLVFAWSKRLFGWAGGLISLTLYVFSPTVLSCARLVTTDMAVALFFISALATTWWALHRVSPLPVILGSLAMAGLFLSKMSAPLIIPVGLVLLVVRLIDGAPLVLAFRKRSRAIRARFVRLGIWCGVIACEALVTYAAIWAAYGFRYEAMKHCEPGRDRFYSPRPLPDGKDVWEDQSRKLGRVAPVIHWLREHKVFPEAYVYSALMSAQTARGRASFLNGQHCILGFRWFFPYSFLVKTPLPLFGVMILALVGAWLRRGGDGARASGPIWRVVGRGLLATAPLWVFLIAYWTVSIRSNLNIGQRHIMPTYPVLFILCGAAAGFFSRKGRWLRAVPAAMLVLFVVASVSIWPHYLAYFNLFAGGPKQGYKHLVDSSLDWGQDLPGLKRWLDKHAPRGPNRPNVYLAYFGRGDVTFEGIKARPLRRTLSSSGTGSFHFSGGIYCISATELQQVYLTRQRPEPTPIAWTVEQEKRYQRLLPAANRLMATPNTREARKAAMDALCREWEKAYRSSKQNPKKMKSRLARYRKSLREFPKLQFARLCAYLRNREPDDSVGYSILIYKLTDEQVQQALRGSLGGTGTD